MAQNKLFLYRKTCQLWTLRQPTLDMANRIWPCS